MKALRLRGLKTHSRLPPLHPLLLEPYEGPYEVLEASPQSSHELIVEVI